MRACMHALLPPPFPPFHFWLECNHQENEQYDLPGTTHVPLCLVFTCEQHAGGYGC